MRNFFLIIGLLFATVVCGQDRPIKNKGIETDLLAWRIGKFPESFCIGGWYGYKGFKNSIVVGHFNLVKNHLPDGFVSDKSTVLNLRSEYFFNKKYKHFYLGPSLLFEHATLKSEKGYNQKLNYFMAGVSTGFLFNIKDLIYFGPSLVAHFPLGNHKYVFAPGDDMPLPWSLEPGLKIGVTF